MIKTLIFISYLSIGLLVAADLQGQSTPHIIDEFNHGVKSNSELWESNVPKATEYFKDLAYTKAIEAYLKKEDKLNEQDKLRLAQSYHLTNQHEEAQRWFQEVITEKSDHKHILQYAQSLQQSDRLMEAKFQYAEYAKRLQRKVGQGDYVYEGNVVNQERFEQHDLEIFNESRVNTEELEFSPAFFNDKIVYVSTNPEIAADGGKDPWIDKNFMGLQIADMDAEGYLEAPRALPDVIQSTYHEGPLSFNANTSELFFTRNSFHKGKKDLSKDQTLKLKIYTTEGSSDGWSEPRPVSFSTADFQECHPALATDGYTMVFASDREGSLGKMDLFITRRDGSAWSEPVNLGNTINTIGNELFPFVDSEGLLYFASDTHDGLGGLDIFVARPISDREWSKPVNLGTPFNSQADDFGYIVDNNTGKGYLASDRIGGYGKDDIYGFNMEVNPFNDNEVVICVQDSLTGAPLSAANLDLSALSIDAKDIEKWTTEADGCIRVTIDSDKNHRVFATKDQYHSMEKIFSKSKSGNKWTVPLYRPGCVYLTGTVTNASANNPLEGAEVQINYLNDRESQALETDLFGKFTLCVPCGEDFEITATKTGFSDGFSMISTAGTDCSSEELITTDIPMQLIITEAAVFTPTEVEVGKILALNNIYYDFDKAYIKDEEQIDLDKLVNTMYEYPGIVIELGAHTDSRGSQEYNQNLSERRAQAAMEYLVDRGIAPSRIIPVGYGEANLRNHCSDGIDCTEYDHLYNRRTEVRILQNSAEISSVQYVDELPSSYTDISAKTRFTTNDINQISNNQAFSSYEDSSLSFHSSRSTTKAIRGLYIGSYSSKDNADKKLNKLQTLGYSNLTISIDPDSGNYRVIMTEDMDEYKLMSIISELENHGIDAIAKYDE